MTTNRRFHVGQRVTALWGNDPDCLRLPGVVTDVSPASVQVRFPDKQGAALRYWDDDRQWPTSGILPLVLRSSLEEGENK
jgi:hypothetical protein